MLKFIPLFILCEFEANLLFLISISTFNLLSDKSKSNGYFFKLTAFSIPEENLHDLILNFDYI